MRSILSRRPSMIVHAALAGALALSATPLLADKLGNFEIQGPAAVAPPQPTSQPTTIQSPRDPASGQATGIQSPRDAASGQATGRTQSPGSTLVNNENVTSARGTATAQPGQFMSGGGGDGTGIRKPRPNKNPRKGRRMHKP